MPERRHLQRYEAQMPVWCESDEFTLHVHTVNVSAGGVFVRTSHTLPPQAAFTVVFKEIGAAARVRVSWVQASPGNGPSGMGLSITDFESGAERYAAFIDVQAMDPAARLD